MAAALPTTASHGSYASYVTHVWVYLSASPLLSLVITLLAYLVAFSLYRRSGFHPLVNPVLISVALLVTILTLTGTSYSQYFQGAQFIHFLLGPATVALAVPLYRQIDKLKRAFFPLAIGLLAGSLTAIISAVLIARAMGASWRTLASLAPKSVTTPIAMAIAEKIGGLPSLAAVLVISTGVIGAVLGPAVLRVIGIRRHDVSGFAIGVASHGIGTARAFQVSAEMGAFAGLAMGLNGIFTAIVVPLLLPMLKRLLGM